MLAFKVELTKNNWKFLEEKELYFVERGYL